MSSSFFLLFIIFTLASLAFVVPQDNYFCFQNDIYPDLHYYQLNSTDDAGNLLFLGFDVPEPGVSTPMTGTFNVRSKTYSFNTNQAPDIYINQWSVAEDGSWSPGFLYSFSTDASLKNPIDMSLQPCNFSPCSKEKLKSIKLN
eukprot:TRINITY_DN2377_c0_g1_i2.p1 TRINITY_DN2377_c0_g1~~TRINITY_DN2377_c0_g1_i2.p1  ORF type:complete len:143 (+),score=37.21 TRINITY_DN2377_c0_g1_i2:148-576(+)